MVEEELVIFHAFGSNVPIDMKEPGKSRDEVELDRLAIPIETHLNSSKSHGKIPYHNLKLERRLVNFVKFLGGDSEPTSASLRPATFLSAGRTHKMSVPLKPCSDQAW